jgi:hypothetical protein
MELACHLVWQMAAPSALSAATSDERREIANGVNNMAGFGSSLVRSKARTLRASLNAGLNNGLGTMVKQETASAAASVDGLGYSGGLQHGEIQNACTGLARA